MATHLLESGMPLNEIQKFLGHEKIDTTQIYPDSSPAMIRESYRRALGVAGRPYRAHFHSRPHSFPIARQR